MDKELEQQAIQTFATVPEIYQQAFREAGADFPDELVGEIKKDPNQAISLLESNKNLKSAVVNIYKQNKDAILQYMQQNTSMFREGGKFDYLKKLQGGGTSPEASFKVENRSTDKKARRSAIRNTRPVPDSGRATNRKVGASVSDTGNQYVYERALVGNPGFGTTTETYATITPQRDTILNQTFPTNSGIVERTYTTGMPEYDTVMDRLRKTGVFDALKSYNEGWKFQEGGRLTRKQALEAAQKNRGFTRQQARRALRNARYAGADRQTAFAMIAGEPSQPESNTSERPQLINSVNSPVGNAVSSNIETINTRPTTDYNNVDFGVFNFNDAFDRARKVGLNEFTWNGKRYTTQLAVPALGPDGKNYSIADTLLSNGNISTPDWWISKQYEIPTALSIGIDPSSVIRAREIHPPLRREGGKLSKENEANKKYIKASEKAGQQASKKMSDLKNKHKAELKKIK